MTTMLALGEVMLRLDPRAGRIRSARSFDVYAGGGEYNVAVGLAALGHATGIVTGLPRTEVGQLALSLIRSSGVDDSRIVWLDDDGIGGRARVGLNFTERGFGARPPLGVSDRAGSAAARLRPGDVDWDAVFADGAIRWLHTGGIFAALTADTAELTADAVAAARRAGATVSFDMNFRPSLHRAITDHDRHAATMRRILAGVDVLFSNQPELRLAIGEPALEDDLPIEQRFARMVTDALTWFPQLRVMAATRRTVRSASRNDWAGLAWTEETGVLASSERPDLEILDRVGGGDAFAAGLIHGLLVDAPLSRALELGVAHGALVMSTPGDGSTATLAEVEALARGGELRTLR